MQIPKEFSFSNCCVGHTHVWRGSMSRRAFIGRAAAGAAVITSPLWRPAVVSAAASDPTPIPQTVAPGAPFHVVLLAPGTEPSLINNFRGVVGGAAVGGQGTALNTDTGATERLLFDIDNRFMKGTYVGAGGHTYEATFAFVWMDLYRGQVDPLAPDTHQIHDFNLDIDPFPAGLFWTRKVDAASVDVDPAHLERGATMHITELNLVDYHTLANSLADGALSGEEKAHVSYALTWRGGGTPVAVNDGSHFRYVGLNTTATIVWSAMKQGFRFVSDPASTTVTNFALIANEVNGVFY